MLSLFLLIIQVISMMYYDIILAEVRDPNFGKELRFVITQCDGRDDYSRLDLALDYCHHVYRLFILLRASFVDLDVNRRS